MVAGLSGMEDDAAKEIMPKTEYKKAGSMPEDKLEGWEEEALRR